MKMMYKFYKPTWKISQPGLVNGFYDSILTIKCKIMHVGTRAEHDHVYTLNVDNTVHELRYTGEKKIIGVIVDSKLEFDKHIYQQINKASSIMAVIRRSFITLNVINFTPLYKALVRSHLEYASCVWSPYKQKYKQAIEKVQRRATKHAAAWHEGSFLPAKAGNTETTNTGLSKNKG